MANIQICDVKSCGKELELVEGVMSPSLRFGGFDYVFCNECWIVFSEFIKDKFRAGVAVPPPAWTVSKIHYNENEFLPGDIIWQETKSTTNFPIGVFTGTNLKLSNIDIFDSGSAHKDTDIPTADKVVETQNEKDNKLVKWTTSLSDAFPYQGVK